MTIRQEVEEKIKKQWYSYFRINMEVKSSSADRELRNIRQNPPEGYKVIQRPFKMDGYRSCLEFKLVEDV